MGSSHSTRKLSVDNENTIQVSQEALERIQAQLAAKQVEAPPPQYEHPPPFYEPQKRKQDDAAEEAYWARRVENLKRAHENIMSSMHFEYQRTLKEANRLFELVQDDKLGNKIPPCQEQKEKVLQCYNDNHDKSLLCSSLVSEFNDCVCKSRVAAVTASA